MAREEEFNGSFDGPVAAKYRQRIQFIEQAPDERDLRAMKSLHYEKLKGARDHQRSIKINKYWRIVLELVGQRDAK